jgi:hypothetical protein
MLGLHLVDSSLPANAPRAVATGDVKLIDGPGRFLRIVATKAQSRTAGTLLLGFSSRESG